MKEFHGIQHSFMFNPNGNKNNVYSGIQVLSQEFSERTFNLQVELMTFKLRLMTFKLRFHDKHHAPCIPAAPSFDFVDFKTGRQAEQQLTSQSAAMLSECGFGATKAEGGHCDTTNFGTPQNLWFKAVYICICLYIII